MSSSFDAARNIEDPVEMHRRHWPETCDAQLIGFAVALERAHAASARRLAVMAARYDLSPTEFDVLTTLRRSGAPWELTPSRIQSSMLITSGGLTKILRQLEARRLISRPMSGSDRRSKPVRLSDKGRRLVERAVGELVPAMGTYVRSILSDAEIERLTTLLYRLASSP